jgi:hypothetical protein
MSTLHRDPPKKLLGLLECPLRRGFIEFEYYPGDCISELKAKVDEVWGQPKIDPNDAFLRTTNTYAYFHSYDSWVILCQDKDGAYGRLKDEDAIPLRPLPSAQRSTGSFFHLFSKNEHELEDDADDHVLLSGLLHIEALHEDESVVGITFRRFYEVPADRTYHVKLLALVAVTGG